jgi:hypothetical protein
VNWRELGEALDVVPMMLLLVAPIVWIVVARLRASARSAREAEPVTRTVRGVVEAGALLLGPVSGRPCVAFVVAEEEESLGVWSARSREVVVADFVVRDAGTAHLVRGAGAVAEIVPAGRHCVRASGPRSGLRRFEAVVPDGETVIVSGRVGADGDAGPAADYRDAGARLVLTGDTAHPLRITSAPTSP